MGATTMFETAPGATPADALETVRSKLAELYPDWPDPLDKDWVQVWPEPVGEEAVEWMRGWCGTHPPEGVDPDDKWGPWLVFPLKAGGWHFFGWVNT